MDITDSTDNWKTLQNKCIGDDTKAAARQALINKIMAKNDFQYGGWNSYTLQCGTIVTLISPGDCTLQCGMWLWNRDIEFTKWQHPAMWYVALGWHAIEFVKTSAILEFYIWFPFLHITAVDMSSVTVCKMLSKSDHPRQKKWRRVDFQDGGSQPSWIVGIQ